MLVAKMYLIFSTLLMSAILGVAQQTLPALPSQAPASAQALPPDAPSRQQILKLFDALKLRRTMEASQDAAMQNAKTVVQGMFRENAAALGPEQQRMLDEMMKGVTEDVRSVLSIDEMLEVIIPVYQRHLTVDDVDALIAFQSSPVGQKVVNLQPIMIQETMQAITPMQQRAMSEVMRRLNERLQKMMQNAPGNPQQD